MSKYVAIVLIVALLLTIVRLAPFVDRYGINKVIDQYERYFASVVYNVINHVDDVRDAFIDGFTVNTFSSILRLLTIDIIGVLTVPIIVLFVPEYVILRNHIFTDSDGLHHGGGIAPRGGDE